MRRLFQNNWVLLLLVVETQYDGLRFLTCLSSNVIWLVTSESIIHTLSKIGVEVEKALPPIFVVVSNADDISKHCLT